MTQSSFLIWRDQDSKNFWRIFWTINLQKIEIMGINISTEIIEELDSIYDCKKGEWPNMYLGLPLKENHKSFFFRKTIIGKRDKFQSSL